MINLDLLLFGYVLPPQIQVLISPRDFLAVGRPCGRKLESLVSAGELLLFTESILRHGIDFVFASAIGNVSDPAAIRRPGDFLFSNSRRARQVANASFLRRRGEHITACSKHCTFAVRGDIEIGDQFADVFPMFHDLIAIAGEINCELLGFRLKIAGIEIARIFEDDRVRPQTRPHYIPLVKVRQLFDLFRSKIVAVEVEVMISIPIGREINLVPMPHWECIGVVGMRHVFAGVVF